MGQSSRTLLIWLVFGFFLVSMWSLFGEVHARNDRVPFSQVISAVEEGRVKQLEIVGQTFTGEFTSGVRFHSTGVLTDGVLDSLQRAGRHFETQYTVRKEQTGTFLLLLLQWLPLLLTLGLFLFFMRQIQAGGNRLMSFGKSRARQVTEKHSTTTFADVAGAGECKRDLREIVAFLENSKHYTRLGGRIPKGVLLIGAPGTGKTLLAKAVAGEARVPFFSISGSEFVEVFVGIGPSRVRDLFEQAKNHAPCVIFIDEIDAVGRHRNAGGFGGGHQEQEQTLTQLLTEMDGFEANTGVVVMAATNRPEILDPAILRPGRFDRHVVVGKPDLSGREAILKVHTRKVRLAEDVDLGVVGRSTPGMSGADLANLVNEAALFAAREHKEAVEMKDFEAAADKIMMGSERSSMVMSAKELKATAYHESGHAMVSCLLRGEKDPVHKVSIIPRGAALGVTMQLPTEDRYCVTKSFACNQIAVLMGGRIAEEIVLGEPSSGAGNDFDKATTLAEKMVCEWGMSDAVGPVVYKKQEEQAFLGMGFNQSTSHSEAAAQKIDAEIRRVVVEQYQRAKNLLQHHEAALHRVARALLDYETITGSELHKLLEGGSIARAKPAVSRFKTPQEWAARHEKPKRKAKPEEMKEAEENRARSEQKEHQEETDEAPAVAAGQEEQQRAEA
ncbi:MAG: ATP-dependent zinc metalloprotease FtsH [Myxococcota bacterium]